MGCESLFDLGEDVDSILCSWNLEMSSILAPKHGLFQSKQGSFGFQVCICLVELVELVWLVGVCIFLGGGLPPLVCLVYLTVVENVEHQNMWSFSAGHQH